MSDRGRVGAVVGSILAGAAVANPFASMLGNVVGFIVGKHSDFSEEAGDEAPGTYVRRTIVPDAAPPGTGESDVPTLALAGPTAGIAAGTAGAAGAAGAAATAGTSETEEPVAEPEGAEPQAEVADKVENSGLDAEEVVADEAGPDAEPQENEDVQVAAAAADDNGGGASSKAQPEPEIAEADTDQGEYQEITVVTPPPESATKDAAPAVNESGQRQPMNLVITKQVGGTQAKLDELAATIRAEQQYTEFEPNPSCPDRNAPRYRKKIAVTGFALETPKQGAFGGIYQAGEIVSGMVYQKFLASGKVQPFAAPNRQMFASLNRAPTRVSLGNELSKYSAVSREMGVQFVVSGVIRNLDVHDESGWDTSTYSSMKRALFSSDRNRAFVVDVVVHDGFTGQVVMEQRYADAGRWEFSRTERVTFGDDRFLNTQYGQVVDQLLTDITGDVIEKLDCQPMLIPILKVDGKNLVLDVGTDSGLLPGDRMTVLRSEHSLSNPSAPPQLWDTGVELHLHSLSLDTSRAWMREYGSVINVQAGDYAVMR